MYKRIFFSGKKGCSLGCLYCFTDIEGFRKLDVIKYEDKNSANNEIMIYYPACDTEFIWSNEFEGFIESLLHSDKQSIISISTKGTIRKSLIEKIKLTNEKLIYEGKGFIKFSVSLSTKSMIDKIEPHTSSYKERIELVKYLFDEGIPSSVILKPILPFISTDEYKEIINDTVDFTDNFLIGGLYLSKDSEFYKQFIEGKYEVVDKGADWLPYKPLWSFIGSKEKTDILYKYILSKNRNVFESDAELLKHLWNNNILEKVY